MRVAKSGLCLASAILAVGISNIVHADANELRIAQQFGISYLPVVVAQENRLIEKHAKAAGAGDISVRWTYLTGASSMNDALLSGSLDIGFAGPPGLAVLWARTRGTSSVRGISSIAAVPLYLVTRNPAVKSIKDLTEKDKIAVPAVKVSIQALMLQMAAAQVFGDANFAKLDPLTVSLSHADAAAAMLSQTSEINTHFTSPPYNYLEISKANGRVILTSTDIVGGLTTNNLAYTTAKFREANPRLYAAFLKGIEEACEIIKRDRRAAVDLYLKATKFKGSPEDVENTYRVVEDRGTEFSLTPHGVTKLADFMFQRGIIKEKAGSWRDLFFPEVHHLPGS